MRKAVSNQSPDGVVDRGMRDLKVLDQVHCSTDPGRGDDVVDRLDIILGQLGRMITTDSFMGVGSHKINFADRDDK